MAVNTANIAVGAGKLRTAPVGTDDLDIVLAANADFTDWDDTGPTDDGINVTIAKSYANHSVDQAVDWVASTPTDRNTALEVNLVDMTHGNLKLSLNGGTETLGVGTAQWWDKFEPETDLIETPEDYIATSIESKTLAKVPRIVVIRRALNVDNIAFSYKKDAKTMLACNWAGHFVSDSIPPFAVYTKRLAALIP
jgi:hypothetical protein